MKKIFTLLFAAMGISAMADNTVTVKYDFENYKLDGKYYSWFEKNADDTENAIWGTGNAGYAYLHGKDAAETYPTTVWAEGRTGNAVKLETKDTYTILSKKAPIAAGNIFLGSFSFNILQISTPVKMTKFGIAYDKKPLSFSFYYKYKAGEKLQDIDRNEVTGKTDKGNAYAVLYDNLDGSFQADGSNILSNENIVAVANSGELDNTDEWTAKNVTFEYSKDIDADKLAAGGYSLALVFTSSVNGAAFEGAIGSVMYVDDVELVCEGEGVELESTTYTDHLKITLKQDEGDVVIDEDNAQVIVTKQEDGKFTFTLKNFILNMGEEGSLPVGTINIKNLEGTETEDGIALKTDMTAAEIVDGDYDAAWMAAMLMGMFAEQGGVPVTLDALMTPEKLYAELSIPLGFMNVDVVFGNNTLAGINNATVNADGVAGIYNVSGVKVNGMQAGQVYILRKADGTSVKVIKR